MNDKKQNDINEERDYQEKKFLFEEQFKEINKIGDKLTARVFYITTFLFVIYLHSFGELLKIERSINYFVKIFGIAGFASCFASITAMFLSFWHSQSNVEFLNNFAFSVFKNKKIEDNLYRQMLSFTRTQSNFAVTYLLLTTLSGIFYLASVVIVYLSL